MYVGSDSSGGDIVQLGSAPSTKKSMTDDEEHAIKRGEIGGLETVSDPTNQVQSQK